MNILTDLLIATADLPDPTQGFDWFRDIIEQVVVFGVIFVLTKFVFKLKIGQIVLALAIGGFAYYAIRNTETVFGWFEALLDLL
ncbi:hypothetical protein ACFQ4Z_12155 [Oceanobacillus oncorhynchi subsp. oncorhynchi]|uniref:hypothetical protein n=1 Tax=Oceanobacillus oncorhynchi TaxID=545501 RepID=UPI00363A3566